MARYRKIDPRIWNDLKFRSLSNNGKLAFLFVLTHPHMTALGAMRSTVPGLAAEIGWEVEAFREAFREALRKGMAEHDEKASFVWLPNFLKYNAPESPNVVKAWADSLDLLPECGMKASLIQHVKAFAEGMTEGFAKALPEAFAKGMPYQEQEQEQEQEQDSIKAARSGQTPAEAARPTRRQRPPTGPFDPAAIDGLDVGAWTRWVGYRAQIRKPIKPASMEEAARELASFGPNQADVVRHSIAQSYTGLYPPKRLQAVNGSAAKPAVRLKTVEELEAEEAARAAG